MQEIRTEIDIAAPATKVWGILTDINHWQDWNPIIIQASGDAARDARLDITMCGKNGKDGPRYKPLITNLEAPKSFHWRAKMLAGFLFTNDKVIELEETGTGTRLVHKELFSGLLAPLFCKQMEAGVTPMLNSMNDALKKAAETG